MRHITQIPIYIEANSKDELMKKMLEVNRKTGYWTKFFDIQKEGKRWIAWFYQDMKLVTRATNNAN